MDYPLISIIIPVKNLNPYLEECIAHCQRLDYSDYEIMVLPDSPLSQNWEDVTVVPTGPVGPSEQKENGSYPTVIQSILYPTIHLKKISFYTKF